MYKKALIKKPQVGTALDDYEWVDSFLVNKELVFTSLKTGNNHWIFVQISNKEIQEKVDLDFTP